MPASTALRHPHRRVVRFPQGFPDEHRLRRFGLLSWDRNNDRVLESVDQPDGHQLGAKSTARMVPACGTLYEMIVNQKIAHNGDPVFADQVLSAAQRSTDMGWRLSKGKSKRKIDGAIALAMAVDRATRRAESVQQPGFFVV